MTSDGRGAVFVVVLVLTVLALLVVAHEVLGVGPTHYYPAPPAH